MLLSILLHLLLLTTAYGVEAEVVVSMTPKSLGHVFKREMSLLHDSILNARPKPFRATYLGLEVTIDNFQVADMKMPRISYETSTSSHSHMTFKLLGGSARLIGQYSAVYKTKRGGQFEMVLDHFHLAVPVQRHGVAKFTPDSKMCTLEVDESMMSLTPALPEQISGKIKTDMLEQLRLSLCTRTTEFFEKLNSKLANFAEATDISQGGHSSHINVELQLRNASPDDDSSVHVAVTESVINAELSKLFSAANTRFLWNDVPEIKELLKKCETTECRAIEDGDITSSLSDRPSIKIQDDDSLLLHLPLSTSFSTSNKKELFTVKSEAHLILENLDIEQPEDGYVSWSAEFKVKELKITKFSSSRNFQKLSSTIESWIKENNIFIENLLNSYLRGSLPVHLRSPLSWSHRLHARPDFSTHSLRFHVHPHFSPPLLV
uniref:Lipid-binding serum glycoprotein N-terminal domain-containing protein n=1 Tax=Caenorhabditis japonica TaxID=281687 RepID=A0A8R1E0J6_CAEJA